MSDAADFASRTKPAVDILDLLLILEMTDCLVCESDKSAHSMRLRDWRRRTRRHCQKLLLRNAAAVLCEQTLRINFYAGGIRGEGFSLHVGVGFFHAASINLKLHSIAVGSW